MPLLLICVQQFLLAAFCDSLGQLRRQAALSEEVASASELLLLEQLAEQSGHDQFAAYVSPVCPSVGSIFSTCPSSPALDLPAKSANNASSGVSGVSDSGDGPDAGCRAFNNDVDSPMVAGDDEGCFPAAPVADPLYLFKLCLSLV